MERYIAVLKYVHRWGTPLRYTRSNNKGHNLRWPVSWMAPTNSYGQEMVSIYLIKIKITTKFFKLANLKYQRSQAPN